MKKRPLSTLVLISLGWMLSITGCTSHYVTTFTPEQEPSRQLNMNYEGPRANIAVGDFTVKARGATNYIGDGLREMLDTALFESMRFNVLDRMDPKGLTAEQQLSYSKMAKQGSPKLGAQMEVAELMMYGTVTEFEAEASGAGLKTEVPSTWDSASVKSGSGSLKGKKAHMAIDIHVVDTASGKLVAARRIAGSAASFMATFGADVEARVQSHGRLHKIRIPASLGTFKNTPMELAIRDCIYRSVIYATQAVPPQYFRH
jgi:curli biogenesis system outer membrane secretion channel CsgG